VRWFMGCGIGSSSMVQLYWVKVILVKPGPKQGIHCQGYRSACHQWACGLKRFTSYKAPGGMQKMGCLSGNVVQHGSVDSLQQVLTCRSQPAKRAACITGWLPPMILKAPP